MKSILLTILLAFTSLASAGDYPTIPPQAFPSLETLVHKADLVLHCRAETVRGKKRWRVIEALKGEYRPKMFDQEIPGFISSTGSTTLANPSRYSGPAPKHAEKVVFLSLERLHSEEDNKWHDCYFTDEAFPVVAAKITYPKTILWSHTPGIVEHEFTLAEFRAAIRSVK